jgi:hypothetical protein
VSPVKYEKGFYIPEDDVLHNNSRGDLKSYIMSCILVESYSFRAAFFHLQGRNVG